MKRQIFVLVSLFITCLIVEASAGAAHTLATWGPAEVGITAGSYQGVAAYIEVGSPGFLYDGDQEYVDALVKVTHGNDYYAAGIQWSTQNPGDGQLYTSKDG